MRKFLFFLLIIFFTVSILILFRTLFLRNYPDFSGYYFGSKAIFENINPYLGGKNFFTPFVYPPFVALFFSPFLLVPFNIAEIIWEVMSLIFLFFSIVFLLKINNQKILSPIGIFLSILVFIFFPVKFSLGMGQINLLILVLICLSLFFYNRGKKTLTGFLFGLCILLKIFPILIFFYFLLTKQWKILISLIFTIIAGLVVSTLFIKPSINIYFYTHTLPSLITGWRTDYYNQSLTGFLGRMGFTGSIGNLLKIFLSILTVLVTFMAAVKGNKSSKKFANLTIGSFITVNLLINNFSWQHHFAWFLIPLFFTFFTILSLKNNLKLFIILGISYLLTATNIKNPQLVPVFLQSHVFIGAFILWVLIVYLLLKNKNY